MARKVLSAILALLVVSISLSGCISQFSGDFDSSDSENGDSSSELAYTEDGIFTCIEHENLTRCWQTHVPEDIDESYQVPLVVDMHGYSSHSTEQRHMSSFDTLADEENFIVVYPDGDGEVDKLSGDTNQSWNAGWCCSHSVNEEIDDVGFIEKMIQRYSKIQHRHQQDIRIRMVKWLCDVSKTGNGIKRYFCCSWM